MIIIKCLIIFSQPAARPGDASITLSNFDFGREPDPPALVMSLYHQSDLDAIPVKYTGNGNTKTAWNAATNTFSPPSRLGDNIITSKSEGIQRLFIIKKNNSKNSTPVFTTDDGGYTTFLTSMLYTLNDLSYPAGVACPTVAAPGIEFSCAFAYMGGTGTGLNYSYGMAETSLEAADRKFLGQ